MLLSHPPFLNLLPPRLGPTQRLHQLVMQADWCQWESAEGVEPNAFDVLGVEDVSDDNVVPGRHERPRESGGGED